MEEMEEMEILDILEVCLPSRTPTDLQTSTISKRLNFSKRRSFFLFPLAFFNLS